ncbi:MAG: RnfABCDGE type electron transport complex subunit G [bacterium]|nr:RnfABCDGE type electron transport complex subunit G [candidate division KSB1 bacterium]MDH7560146.1 RnfABCDGE type electron transport complex subunit G [bacterium]
MKEIGKFSGTLLLVTVVAAGALSAVNSVTKPRIERQQQLKTLEALGVALPGAPADAIEPVRRDGRILYYVGYEAPGSKRGVGYGVTARGKGYAGDVETLVGVDTSFTIVGIRVLAQRETPGLGTKIVETRPGETVPYFQAQFVGRTAAQCKVDKDGGPIVSITGATISSRAVANAVAAAIDSLRLWLSSAEGSEAAPPAGSTKSLSPLMTQ